MTGKKNVPPMHDAYYKARKLYVVFSLLLFINEFAGIVDIKITDIINKVNILGIEINVAGLKINPSAVQLAVMLYFFIWAYSLARFLIEWRQVDQDRRKADASRWDFWLTHFVAIAALTLWGVQRISGIRVAKEPLKPLLPFLVGLIVPFIIDSWKKSEGNNFDEKKKKRYKITSLVLFITAFALMVVNVYLVLFIEKKFSFILIPALVGAFSIGWIIKNILEGIPPSSPSSPPTPENHCYPTDPRGPSDSSDPS